MKLYSLGEVSVFLIFTVNPYVALFYLILIMYKHII
jgi:hypothetical protein